MPRTKSYSEDEVLDKAMVLFWKKGYHATSVQDLVSHLGINRGSLYSSFGDKKQLFDRSLERYREVNAHRIQEFLASQPIVKPGLRALFENALNDNLSDHDKKGCFLVNTATELANIDLEIKKLLKSNQKFFVKLFHDYLEKGKASGELKTDVESKKIANLLFTFYNGLRVIGKIHDDKREMLASIEPVLQML